MYNIELNNVKFENAQTEVLRAVENLCDTFHIEHHLGTISYALFELIDLMQQNPMNHYGDFSINFYVDNDQVNVQITDYNNFNQIEDLLTHASINDADTRAFTVLSLTDRIEFRNQGKEMWIEIAASPLIDAIDRAELLMKKQIKTAHVDCNR